MAAGDLLNDVDRELLKFSIQCAEDTGSSVELPAVERLPTMLPVQCTEKNSSHWMQITTDNYNWEEARLPEVSGLSVHCTEPSVAPICRVDGQCFYNAQ